MKKLKCISMIAALAIAISSCSDSGTEPTIEQIPTPKYFYEIDVKTELAEKLDITGAKNGFEAFMEEMGSNWCERVEFGEDYEFWLQNPIRTQNGNKRTVTITLSIVDNNEIIVKNKNITGAYPKTCT